MFQRHGWPAETVRRDGTGDRVRMNHQTLLISRIFREISGAAFECFHDCLAFVYVWQPEGSPVHEGMWGPEIKHSIVIIVCIFCLSRDCPPDRASYMP